MSSCDMCGGDIAAGADHVGLLHAEVPEAKMCVECALATINAHCMEQSTPWLVDTPVRQWVVDEVTLLQSPSLSVRVAFLRQSVKNRPRSPGDVGRAASPDVTTLAIPAAPSKLSIEESWLHVMRRWAAVAEANGDTAEAERTAIVAEAIEVARDVARSSEAVDCFVMHCPSCLRAVEDKNAACEAMTCEGCRAAFCNICRQQTGVDAHLHLRTRHANKRLTDAEKVTLLRERKAAQLVDFLNRQVRHPVLVALVLLRFEEQLCVTTIDAVTLTIDSKVDLYVWPRLNLSTTSTQHQKVSVILMRRIVALAPLQIDLSPLLAVCRSMPEVWSLLAAESSAPLTRDMHGLTLARRRSTMDLAVAKLIGLVTMVDRNVLDCMVSADQLVDHLTRLAQNRSIDARTYAVKACTQRWPCPEVEQVLDILWNTTNLMCEAVAMYDELSHRTPQWRNQAGRSALMVSLRRISRTDHPVAQYLRDYWSLFCSLHANPHAGSVVRFHNGRDVSLLTSMLESLALPGDQAFDRWVNEAFGMLACEAEHRAATATPCLKPEELKTLSKTWSAVLSKAGAPSGKELAQRLCQHLTLVEVMLRSIDPTGASSIVLISLQVVQRSLGDVALLACVQQHHLVVADVFGGALPHPETPVGVRMVITMCGLISGVLQQMNTAKTPAPACCRVVETMAQFFFVVDKTSGRVSFPSLDVLFAEARRPEVSPRLELLVRKYTRLVDHALSLHDHLDRQGGTGLFAWFTQRLSAAIVMCQPSIVKCLSHAFSASTTPALLEAFLHLAIVLRRVLQVATLHSVAAGQQGASTRRRIGRALVDGGSCSLLESNDRVAFEATTTHNFLHTVEQWRALLRLCADDLVASKAASEGNGAVAAEARSRCLVHALRHAVDAGVSRNAGAFVANNTTSRSVYIRSCVDREVLECWQALAAGLGDDTKSTITLRRAYRPSVALHASSSSMPMFSHGLPSRKRFDKVDHLMHLVPLFEHLPTRSTAVATAGWKAPLLVSIRSVWQKRLREPTHSPHLTTEEQAVFLITRSILARPDVFRSDFRAELIELVCIGSMTALAAAAPTIVAWTYYGLSVLPGRRQNEEDLAAMKAAMAVIDCAALVQAWPRILRDCANMWDSGIGFFTAYQTPLIPWEIGASPLKLLPIITENACASELILAAWRDRFTLESEKPCGSDVTQLTQLLDQVAVPDGHMIGAVAAELANKPESALRLASCHERSSATLFKAMFATTDVQNAPRLLQLTPERVIYLMRASRILVSSDHVRYARGLIAFVAQSWAHENYNFAFSRSMAKAVTTAVRQLRVGICLRKRKSTGKRTSLCRLLAALLWLVSRLMHESSRHTVANCHTPIQAEITTLLLGQQSKSCVIRLLPGLVAYADALSRVVQSDKVDLPTSAFCSSLLQLTSHPKLDPGTVNFNPSTQALLRRVVPSSTTPMRIRFSVSSSSPAAAAPAVAKQDDDDVSMDSGEEEEDDENGAEDNGEEEDDENGAEDNGEGEDDENGAEDDNDEEEDGNDAEDQVEDDRDRDQESVEAVHVEAAAAAAAAASPPSDRRKRKKQRARTHRSTDKHAKTE